MRQAVRGDAMDEQLQAVVLSRLNADESARTDWAVLVLAALQGSAELEALLDNGTRPTLAELAQPVAPKPASVYLAAITVEGFRGIGPAVTLELPPGPGLTLVVGRNGSGKSSFAEALEVLLTGDTFRWQGRTQVWREGWRNLHHPTARIQARFALEGERGAGTVARRWNPGEPLDAGVAEAQVHGKPRTTLAALGWADTLRTHRPLLSYDELGALLDGSPSVLFDAMASILGLDDLVAAQRALQTARLDRERARKEAQEAHARLLVRLRGLDDERARTAVQALDRKKWDLEAAERVVAGTAAGAEAQSALDVLRRLASLELADPERVVGLVRELRDASRKLREASGTAAARARMAADLLEQALGYHEVHGDGDCPVCGRPDALHAAWRADRQGEILGLRQAAEAADAAHRRVEMARKAVDALVVVPSPALFSRTGALGLDAAPVLAALEYWERGRGAADPDALATHLETALPPLRTAPAALAGAARVELERREDTWRPVAAELSGWLPRGRAALRAAAGVALLSAAEGWLKQATGQIRRERFAPVAAKARAIWELLRRDSNVNLEDIALAGEGPRRRVDLDVTVDGVGAAALGVMSQGELRALALSLFVPRASLPESPFRFLVIDDPVQSMDPARVDGLARALELVARERQVVVFTHDDRLPEAVRWLAIEATVIEVTRREGSVVELRPALDPVAQHLADAFALAKTSELPAAVAERVIPGFCRLALEAACATAVRRRRLTRGESHAAVARLLEEAGRLTVLAALAWFDDPSRHADVLPRIEREGARAAAEAFRQCN
jgi:energy-coupling factor transporter ATP-binding protein EcfA2